MLCLDSEPGHLRDGPLLIHWMTQAQILFQPTQQRLPCVLPVNPGAEHAALGQFTREECVRAHGVSHYSSCRDGSRRIAKVWIFKVLEPHGALWNVELAQMHS